jgi:hypothetical protein
MALSFYQNFNKKFLKAPLADKEIIIYILFWSMIIRFCLLFLPFKLYRHLLGEIHTVANYNADDKLAIDKALYIKQLISIVSSHTPWNSKCLVQAIVCKRLLRKEGINTTLFLGAANNAEEKKLDAHAWLKYGDTVITGRSGHKRFKVVSYYS